MTQSPGRVPLLPAAPGETKQSRRSLKQAVRDATELLNKISDRIYEAVPQDDWAPPFDAIPSAVQQAIRLQMAPLETRIALEPLLDDAEKLMAELRKKAGARRGDREGEARALADSIEVMLVQRSGKTVPYSDGVRLFELRALERVPEDGLFEFNIWEPPARDGSRRGTAMQIAISEQGPEVIFSRPSIKTSPSTTFTKPRLREPAFQRGLRRAA